MTDRTETPPNDPAGPRQHRVGDQRLRIAFSWLVVGVPLLYGIVQAVRSSLQLFAG